MRASTNNSIPSSAQASTRISLLLAGALLVGFAAGALVVYRSTRPKEPTPVTEDRLVLSESTRTVLGQLRSPVEVRFYALYGGDNAPVNLRELASRVGELLSAMEAEAPGRLTVARIDSWTPANTRNAAADGLLPITTGTGDPNYLGVAVMHDRRKETIPQLAPEWAAALEMDLARVIARVGTPPPMPRTAEAVAQTGQAEQAVKVAIPNAAATSLEDGKQILRDASLKAYQALVGEMNRELQQAEQVVQNAATATDRQAALKKLQEVRSSYLIKIRDVALESQAEIEAWTKLKGQ